MRLRIIIPVLIAASQSLTAQTSATVALQSSPNPSVFGAPVTLTATVASGSDAGTVTFYSGVKVLGVAPVANGQATLTTSLLNASTHTLYAYYAGQSAETSQRVNAVAEGGFKPAVIDPAGAGQTVAATGDFNLDGKTDLAVANCNGGVSILLGNADGTFKPAVSYASSLQVSFVAIGDFNGDGKPDLAVSAFGEVGILLGNGDGTFQAPNTFPVGNGPSSIAVIDANGDGNADLAVLNSNDVTISVLLGNGDGTFQSAVRYFIANSGSEPQMMVAGDFNGDGKPDLAVALYTSGMVAILLGNGDGTFQLPADYPAGTPYNATSVAVGDFNADGKADLVVGLLPTAVAVLLGDGDGTFQPPVISDSSIDLVPYFAGALVVGDFNGDGKPDIAAADSPNTNTNGVAVALGNGDGTFQPPIFYRTGTNPTHNLVVGDFGGDGRIDLAATTLLDTSVGVLLGQAAVNPTMAAVSVSPLSGTGVSHTFGFQFSDSAGVNDIATVTGLFGQQTRRGTPMCAVTYNLAQNTLALWNEDGSLPAGMAPGSGSQQNSYCSLNGSASSVILSENSLTLNLAIVFTTASRGQKTTWGQAVSTTGSTSGWQPLGSWTAGQAPQVISVSPSSGTGMAGTFTFVYTDPYGATDLSVVEMIVQTQQSYCIVEAYPNQGTLSLLNGGNNGATLGIAGTTLQSGQCTVNAGASSGVISGNTYTLTLSLTFTSSLAGTNRVIGYAVSNDGANSGFQTLGGWNVYPRCNVTADATASVSDVQRIVNEALGAMPGVDDLNQDGLVNVADVQIVLNATLGKGCSL